MCLEAVIGEMELVCAIGGVVISNVFVFRHKGFKIRYKGVCACSCVYKAQGDM